MQAFRIIVVSLLLAFSTPSNAAFPKWAVRLGNACLWAVGFGQIESRVKSARLTVDIRFAEGQEMSLAAYEAVPIRWRDQVGTEVLVRYYGNVEVNREFGVADDAALEVPQRVESLTTIEAAFPRIAGSIRDTIAEHKKTNEDQPVFLSTDWLNQLTPDGNVRGPSIDSAGEHFQFLVDQKAGTLVSEIIHTEFGAFVISGQLGRNFTEQFWRNLLSKFPEKNKLENIRQVEPIEIAIVHTHPGARTPLSPQDLRFAKNVLRRFKSWYPHLNFVVRIIAAPIEARGKLIFYAEVGP